ncbi:MAG: glycosyltransferase family 2 protein [Gammaproteobacteria bacterium]|nr:glycosyltransferase family 2 protein [Gammaproteobacteria bacterium]
MQNLILICVPTYQRPVMLQKCLSALAALEGLDAYRVECLIVDNDAAGSARAVVTTFASKAPWPLHYVIEPARGLVCVRNRVLEEAVVRAATYLACLDDDEWPAPVWLARHLEALVKFNAEVTTGPVIPVAENEITPPGVGGGKARPRTGEQPHHVACNNVVFHRRLLVDQALRFDPRYNFIGGEDFDFFDSSRALGNRHVWVAEATVFETIPPERQTARYIFKRHFSGGINSVVFYRKRHGRVATWSYFTLRAFGKLLSASVVFPLYVLSGRYRSRSLKRVANALGFISGLFKFSVERYR